MTVARIALTDVDLAALRLAIDDARASWQLRAGNLGVKARAADASAWGVEPKTAARKLAEIERRLAALEVAAAKLPLRAPANGRDWKTEAFQMFGYDIGGDANHDAIATALAEIGAILETHDAVIRITVERAAYPEPVDTPPVPAVPWSTEFNEAGEVVAKFYKGADGGGFTRVSFAPGKDS